MESCDRHWRMFGQGLGDLTSHNIRSTLTPPSENNAREVRRRLVLGHSPKRRARSGGATTGQALWR